MAAHVVRKSKLATSGGVLGAPAATAAGLSNVHAVSGGAAAAAAAAARGGNAGSSAFGVPDALSSSSASTCHVGQRKKRRTADALYGVSHPSHAHYAHCTSASSGGGSQGPHCTMKAGALLHKHDAASSSRSGRKRSHVVASELQATSKFRPSSSSRGSRAAASSLSGKKAAAAVVAAIRKATRPAAASFSTSHPSRALSSSVCVERPACVAAASAGDSSPLSAARPPPVCVSKSSNKQCVGTQGGFAGSEEGKPVVGALRPPPAPSEGVSRSNKNPAGSVLLTMSGDSSPTRPVPVHTAASSSTSSPAVAPFRHPPPPQAVPLPPSTASSASSSLGGKKRARSPTADEQLQRAPKMPHRLPNASRSSSSRSVEAAYKCSDTTHSAGGSALSAQKEIPPSSSLPMPDTLKGPHARKFLRSESSSSDDSVVSFCKSGGGLELPQAETLVSQAVLLSGAKRAPAMISQGGSSYVGVQNGARSQPSEGLKHSRAENQVPNTQTVNANLEDRESSSGRLVGHGCSTSISTAAAAMSDVRQQNFDGETSRRGVSSSASASKPEREHSSKKRSRGEYERERSRSPPSQHTVAASDSPYSHSHLDEELSPCSSPAGSAASSSSSSSASQRHEPPQKRAKASAAASRVRSRPVELRVPLPFGAEHAYEHVCAKDVEREKYAREQEYHGRLDADCLARHVGLHPPMRSILLDWLFEVSQQFLLSRVTAHISIYYVDCFLSLSAGHEKGSLQLVGITALFVAAKFHARTEECPSVADFAAATGDNCTADAILAMEKHLLDVLNWELMPIPAVQWVAYYFQCAVLGADRRIASIDRLLLPADADADADDADPSSPDVPEVLPSHDDAAAPMKPSSKIAHTPASMLNTDSFSSNASHDKSHVPPAAKGSGGASPKLPFTSFATKSVGVSSSSSSMFAPKSLELSLASASAASFSDSMSTSSSVTALESCHSQDSMSSAFSQVTQRDDYMHDSAVEETEAEAEAEADAENDSQETVLSELASDFAASPRLPPATRSGGVFSSPVSMLSASSVDEDEDDTPALASAFDQPKRPSAVRRPLGDVTEMHSPAKKRPNSATIADLTRERQELATLVADLRQPALFVRVMELLDLSSLDTRLLAFLPSDLAMCACYLVFGNHAAFSFELFSDGRLFEPRDTVIDRLSDGIRFVKNFSRVPYFGVVRLTHPYFDSVVPEERQHEIQMFNPDALELLFQHGVLDREARTPHRQHRRR